MIKNKILHLLFYLNNILHFAILLFGIFFPFLLIKYNFKKEIYFIFVAVFLLTHVVHKKCILSTLDIYLRDKLNKNKYKTSWISFLLSKMGLNLDEFWITFLLVLYISLSLFLCLIF